MCHIFLTAGNFHLERLLVSLRIVSQLRSHCHSTFISRMDVQQALSDILKQSLPSSKQSTNPTHAQLPKPAVPYFL